MRDNIQIWFADRGWCQYPLPRSRPVARRPLLGRFDRILLDTLVLLLVLPLAALLMVAIVTFTTGFFFG